MRLKQTALQALLVFGVFGSVSIAPLSDHHLHAQAPRQLPPLQYSCPHHPEVLQDKPGICHLCKMTLEPTRIDTELHYSCPDHPVVVVEKPGICPVDRRRELVPVWSRCIGRASRAPTRTDGPGSVPTARSASSSSKSCARRSQPAPRRFVFHGAGPVAPPRGTYPRAGLFRAFFFDTTRTVSPGISRAGSSRVRS